MKKLTLALFALLAAPATAQEMTPDELCATFATYAEVVMKARQGGVPLGQMLDTIDGEPVLRALLMVAYDQPRFSTESYQQDAISTFRDEVHLGCLQAQ